MKKQNIKKPRTVREIIKSINENNAHIQILQNEIDRDLDILLAVNGKIRRKG